MWSRMGLKMLAMVAALTAAAQAQAGVQCPPTQGGHPLRALGGGTLYEGPIANNAALAPSNTQGGGSNWVNTWRFVSPPDVTLVCRYSATPAPITIHLTPDVRGCRQDERSFACQ